jgi:LPXTG-motif cell wall-anchored protein
LHLAHPYTTKDTATVTNGQISAYVGMTTPQTVADLAAASQPPGMPKTGGANPAGLLVLLGAGLLALLTGGLVRRFALARR